MSDCHWWDKIFTRRQKRVMFENFCLSSEYYVIPSFQLFKLMLFWANCGFYELSLPNRLATCYKSKQTGWRGVYHTEPLWAAIAPPSTHTYCYSLKGSDIWPFKNAWIERAVWQSPRIWHLKIWRDALKTLCNITPKCVHSLNYCKPNFIFKTLSLFILYAGKSCKSDVQWYHLRCIALESMSISD